MSTKKPRDGISLRRIQILLMFATVLLSGLMLFSTFRLSSSFQKLTDTSQEQVQLRNAARELTDYSDYLTEKVQRFAITGDEQYMNAYFKEALVLKHRDEAIDTMKKGDASKEALDKLLAASEASDELMEREYYSMCLVMEAYGYKNYPDELKTVTLRSEDAELSSEKKMALARDMVFDDEYYAQKTEIRKNMRASLDELEKSFDDTNARALSATRERLLFARIMIISGAVGVFFLVWLVSRLGIHPILDAVERIKKDRTISEKGASEFRYLVRAYNKMYANYQKSLKRLNYKASHDELTGVYNRTGYKLLLENIDLSSTYMFLFDLDDFKGINDTYGHDIGDAILVKFVSSLKHHFRPDDFICRVGGDEFVVFMQHASKTQETLIAEKIELINKELADTHDGLPNASCSVGIMHGSDAEEVEDLFEKTDEAMYRAKQSGKNTHIFYNKT